MWSSIEPRAKICNDIGCLGALNLVSPAKARRYWRCARPTANDIPFYNVYVLVERTEFKSRF